MQPSPEPQNDPSMPPASDAPAATTTFATAPGRKPLRITVVGIGGAGRNGVEALAGRGLSDVKLVVLNTDAMALEGGADAVRIRLGDAITRGLGAGGDPEVGRAAAESDLIRLKEVCTDSDLVFIIAGMGGGTGTGAAPVVARVAKEAGALALCVVTLPFPCEGVRRQRQAAWGIEQLKAVADAVICLPNEKALKLVDPHRGLMEVFGITNDLLAEGVCSIWRLLTRPGIMHVDFADLCSVLRGRHAESLLATATARGPQRLTEIGERLLNNPYMNSGRGLDDSDAVLVSFVGGPDFSMSDLAQVMELVHKHCGSAHVFIGATIDPGMHESLAVTVIASKGGRLGVMAPPQPAEPASVASINLTLDKPETGPVRSHVRFAPPSGPDIGSDALSGARAGQDRSGSMLQQATRRLRQGMLPLEVVSRGRFEKSEPTLHRGEDLDIPTYIRRGTPLN